MSIARSYIGSFCPRSAVQENEVFVAIRAYLDSSGKADKSFVTLAAFAAPDSIWNEFENGWRSVLNSSPLDVDHMHMAPAVHKRYGSPWCANKGWDDTRVWELVFKLLKFIDGFDRSSFSAFSCIVDMNAIRKLRSEGLSVPSEVFFCNKYCGEYIIATLGKSILRTNKGKDVITLSRDDLLHFVFDMNESFHAAFSDEWKQNIAQAENSGKASYWQLVDSVTESSMKRTPGIQAADMLAWSTNRENTAEFWQFGTGLAEVIRNITSGASMICDEDFIRRFLEGESERTRTIRASHENNPSSRSEGGERGDGSGEKS